jgi:hypothetical protein
VNLIYAVFFQLETKEFFFENIAQDVDKCIEIDYAEVRGAASMGGISARFWLNWRAQVLLKRSVST